VHAHQHLHAPRPCGTQDASGSCARNTGKAGRWPMRSSSARHKIVDMYTDRPYPLHPGDRGNRSAVTRGPD
jgi:hypothetical protein